MNSLVYFFADLYPWWAIPASLTVLEIGHHFRRKGRRLACVGSYLFSLLLITLAVLYVYYGGFRNMRPLLQTLERTYLN